LKGGGQSFKKLKNQKDQVCFQGGEEEVKQQLPLFFYRFSDWTWLDKALEQFAEPSTANLRQILGQIDERRPGGERVARSVVSKQACKPQSYASSKLRPS